MVILLLGIGMYLTLRLGFVQIKRLGHGIAVASGKYDDPEDEGDVTHFQALTTALSATVGIGNIAGVAIAIHWGGPGALFWMWVTAAVGMATKYSEVTLAQKYRVQEHEGEWAGTVSGGPMYYIERGLGPKWKWMAVFFAICLGLTAFTTGSGVQANTVADSLLTEFGIPKWVSGLTTSALVAAVILGGITRIGRVTLDPGADDGDRLRAGRPLRPGHERGRRAARLRPHLPGSLQPDRGGGGHRSRRLPRDPHVGGPPRALLQRGGAGVRADRPLRGQDRRAGVRRRRGPAGALHRHPDHLHDDGAAW